MSQILIDPISAVSLLVVGKGDNVYLVTNWHVVSGRHAATNKPLSSTGGIPNRLLVWHHAKSQLGNWTSASYDLLDEAGNKQWIDIARLFRSCSGQQQCERIHLGSVWKPVVLEELLKLAP